MQLRFNESQIRYYADKYLAEELGYDNPIEEIVDEVKGRGYLTKADLIAVSDWAKNQRQKPRIRSNSDGSIEKITGSALRSDTSEQYRISVPCKLDGIGPVVATAILHWFHNDDYPIWSPQARYSVGIYKMDNTLKPREWQAYVKLFRKLVKDNEVEKRTLDRALWKYSESGGA